MVISCDSGYISMCGKMACIPMYVPPCKCKEHRHAYCGGSQIKFCPPALVGIIFTSLTMRELQWGRKAGQDEEREIEVPYGSGWKTDGGSLEKSNLLSSGILRNVSLLGC